MLTGRPGVRSAVPRLGTESSDTRDRAPLNPRLSGGHHRPGAYLNMKIQLEKNFEEERQILLQQQKICRNRARKYFVESNRRKKAFEDKLKEQEEREHQIREQILQQRKQKFEEVTEKFQRAHIPLSQQRRAVFQKPVPPLEEALKQIQESNLKSKVNFSSSHRPAINWRSIPACPAVSSPDPYLPDQPSPSRAPLLSHHSQILPSYPTVSPTRQPYTLPIRPSVPSTLPKTFLPSPLLSYPTKYLPRPPAPVTPSFSSSFPFLPAPIPSGPPDHLPLPPRSSPTIPDSASQSKLFYKTFRRKHFLPAQQCTPATLIPALVRRSLPAQPVVSPTPLEALPVLKPSSLSSHPPHQLVPTLSYIAPLPEHPASLDPFQSVQQSVPQTTLSSLPQAIADHLPASVLSHPPPCHSPSSSLSSSPSTSRSSSSPSVQFSSSSSILASPSPSSSTSPSLPLSSIPLFSSPLHSTPSPCLLPTYLDFPSPIPPVSSSFMLSSSFPPMLHSPSLSTSPSPFIPMHPFNPPHWGKKVEKRREASGVVKKEIEKKELRDDNFKAIDNALPSLLSKNDQKPQKYLLSKINCDKEMKENSKTNLATNKDAFQLKLVETQKLLEDQHLSSLQKFCNEVNQITNSETLSSIDSLEAAEHEEIYLTLTNKEPSTSIQQNSIFLKSVNLQSTNLRCLDEDNLSFSKTQHINNWLVNLDDPNTQPVTPFSDILSKPNILPSRECFNSKEQNPSALCRTAGRATNTTNNLVAFVCSPPISVHDKNSKKTSETSTVRTADSSSEAFKKERPLVTESPTLKFSKVCNTPDSLTQEMATISDQIKYSELTQENKTTSNPTSFLPLATSLILPSNIQSAEPLPKNSIHIKEINPVQCSDKLGELKDVKDEKIKYFNSNNEDLPLLTDTFPAAYIPHNSDSKDKKQKITETSSSNVSSNYDIVGQHKKMKYNIHENSVRFLKSILKKESKYYQHDYFKTPVINQGFKLGNQKAEAIRDSIELIKEKGKSTEIPKTIKKLRWFDETEDIGKNAEDNHSLENGPEIYQQWSQPFHIQTNSGAASNIIRVPACAVNSANRTKPKDDSISENVAALGGFGTNHVSLNCFIPSDFNIAKQAWPASKKEESKAPIHHGDSKTQKANLQRGRTKGVSTKSAQVQSGFLYPNRKGTVLRAQSASKANTFSQAQGKLIVPHPPNSPPNIRSDKNIQVSQCQSEMPENSQNIITNNYVNSKHVLLTEHKLNQWNKERSLPLSHVCSDSITVMPSLSYCSSECQTLAKINHSNSTQIIAQQDGTSYCTQRCPVYEESHHSMAFRSTKEKSVPLWKRRHNILGQNEKAADSTVMRRKQIVENKQRNLLEQKIQNPGTVGHKYSKQMNNFGQSIQQSSSEPKQTKRGTSNIEEVSDSTAEFLMAENLVKSSVPEDEILTIMSSKQLQKPNLASNKTQQLDICAISTEEQKILQSLNRLNERLYNVQETICKNPSIKNTLQIIPFLNIQPRTSLSPDIGSRLQRKY